MGLIDAPKSDNICFCQRQKLGSSLLILKRLAPRRNFADLLLMDTIGPYITESLVDRERERVRQTEKSNEVRNRMKLDLWT